MRGFIDETRIEVFSGNGGPGAVSFRREKYVEKGGPDGGDGGKGGNVIFQVRRNLKTFSHLNSKHTFKAKNGGQGMGRKKHGANGADVLIQVPPGTIIRDYNSKEVIIDFSDSTEKDFVFLVGGRGGQGNWHFRSAKRQLPRFAQPGEEGEYRELLLELNMIADLGFVGFPNAGKSSLLKMLTNADPRVAEYAFTTKIPNLGVMRIHDKDVILADIPGIIEGAHRGTGLGIRFLKHISRTAALVFMVDLSNPEFLTHYEKLLFEVGEFQPELLEKPRLLIATKTDIEGTDVALKELKETYPDLEITAISVFARTGIEEIKKKFFDLSHK
ncbi:GTPase ObgE [Thiospirochaeta perfilievii]|uniref:GTPase Obg n=1 Tax=Thiospirochaeta perfilievii TaxID=252967 RepID=A0A5C1QI36_9SPIO|nr:GTPase ObgE [Thiospirochaeta perfilievii]QEN06206.1 GTPase ObgE [Thiospirochaeta perfilievii]